jgi:hypothetical protein
MPDYVVIVLLLVGSPAAAAPFTRIALLLFFIANFYESSEYPQTIQINFPRLDPIGPLSLLRILRRPCPAHLWTL